MIFWAADDIKIMPRQKAKLNHWHHNDVTYKAPIHYGYGVIFMPGNGRKEQVDMKLITDLSMTVDNHVHRDSEHRILPYKIQIRTLKGCGLLRACSPITRLRKKWFYEKQCQK